MPFMVSMKVSKGIMYDKLHIMSISKTGARYFYFRGRAEWRGGV
jgi:hypothetical protein